MAAYIRYRPKNMLPPRNTVRKRDAEREATRREDPLPFSPRGSNSYWRACARRAGANKSLSNCSAKNSRPRVALGRWRPTKGPALKPHLRRSLFRRPRSATALFIDIYSRRDTGATSQRNSRRGAFVRADAARFFRTGPLVPSAGADSSGTAVS